MAIVVGWLEFRLDSPISEVITAVLLLTVLVFSLEALPEELVFRGYVHRNLIAVVLPWAAVTAQALIFVAFGLSLWVISAEWGVLVERVALFFAMGVVPGIIRHISGSLWVTIGFHLAS